MNSCNSSLNLKLLKLGTGKNIERNRDTDRQTDKEICQGSQASIQVKRPKPTIQEKSFWPYAGAKMGVQDGVGDRGGGVSIHRR